MKFRNQFMKYYQEAGEDGATDGGQQGGEQQPDTAALLKEVEALRAHNEKLLTEAKSAKAKKREADDAVALAAEEAARKSGDVAALDKSWQEKFAKGESEWKTQNERLNRELQGLLVDNVAQKAAAEIAVDAECGELLADKIKGFLSIAERDGKMQTVVVDADGKPSALTVDELKKQLIDKYPRLVKGSPAGGAGGAAFKSAGGAGGTGGDDMVSRAKAIISQHR